MVMTKRNYLFLDDERFPPNDGNDWTVCRNFGQAVSEVTALHNLGEQLDYVSFDNDLGETLEGRDFAKWLVDFDMESDILSPTFSYYVHSQNPVARDWIDQYIFDYLCHKEHSLAAQP
jgi:hypothetical protein